MTYARCMMILADGSRPDVFAQLLAAGELPAIQKYIVDPGGQYRGVTTFPSTTGPAYMPFLTGKSAAACNVPGIRWMDKAVYRPGTQRGVRSYVGLETYLINRDVTAGVPSLFSLIPQSYNIFNGVNRGVSWRGNLSKLSRIWHCYYAHLTDRWNFVDQTVEQQLCSVAAREFGFCFAVFYGIDEYSHLDSPFGEQTRQSYQQLDRAIEETAQRLAAQGKLEDTLWWIVSDHGLSETNEHCCLNTFLDARGWNTLFYPKVYRRNATAANMMSGNGMSHLYFRHREGWNVPVDYEYLLTEDPRLVEDLLTLPAVDLLAIRDVNDSVRVQTKSGTAILRAMGLRMQYERVHGDPLALGDDCILSAQESLERTINHRYPDAPFQLTDLFTSSRTGDIVVSAAPGFDLREAYEDPEHFGSHGSLHRDHMAVPILTNMALPDVPMRTTEVFSHTLAALAASGAIAS